VKTCIIAAGPLQIRSLGTATTPCGSEPARDENNTVPKKKPATLITKIPLLQPSPTPVQQATNPCAFAYNYARIRPLVRLVPGFYCLPATAHQWSGLVARLVIFGCMSVIQSGLRLHFMVAVRMAPSGAPGLVTSPVY